MAPPHSESAMPSPIDAADDPPRGLSGVPSPDPEAGRRVRRDIALLCAILALGVVTRLYHLGAESLWLDEATTFIRAKLPIGELIANSVRKMHVPTYFLVMHQVLALGDDEWMLRIPSAVAGILKLLPVAGAAYILGGLRAGAAAALLLVLAPTHVRYDQEARMYAMQTFGTCLALLGQVWLLAHPAAAVQCIVRGRRTDLPLDRGTIRRGRLAWGAWVLGVLLALYMHNTSALYLVASSAATLGLLIADPSVRWRFFWHWVAANVLVLLLWTPWLPSLFSQLGTSRFQHREWGGAPTLGKVLGESARLFLGSNSLPLRVIVAGMALHGIWTLRRRPALISGLLLLSLASPLLIALVSLHKPMFMPRILLWGGPAFYVLAGCGLAAVPSRRMQNLALLAVAILGLLALHDRYYADTLKTDWRGAALVLSRNRSRDVVGVTNSFKEKRPIAYYAQRTSFPIELPPLYEASASGEGSRLSRALTPGREVVLVYGGRPQEMPPALQRIAERGQLLAQVKLARVVVERYRITRR